MSVSFLARLQSNFQRNTFPTKCLNQTELMLLVPFGLFLTTKSPNVLPWEMPFFIAVSTMLPWLKNNAKMMLNTIFLWVQRERRKDKSARKDKLERWRREVKEKAENKRWWGVKTEEERRSGRDGGEDEWKGKWNSEERRVNRREEEGRRRAGEKKSWLESRRRTRRRCATRRSETRESKKGQRDIFGFLFSSLLTNISISWLTDIRNGNNARAAGAGWEDLTCHQKQREVAVRARRINTSRIASQWFPVITAQSTAVSPAAALRVKSHSHSLCNGMFEEPSWSSSRVAFVCTWSPHDNSTSCLSVRHNAACQDGRLC